MDGSIKGLTVHRISIARRDVTVCVSGAALQGVQSPRYGGKRDVAEHLQPQQQQQAKRCRGSPIKTGLAIEPETPETGGLPPLLPLAPSPAAAALPQLQWK